MFEMDGISEELAKEAMRLAMHKLPVKCKFVTKKNAGAGGTEIGGGADES
jgi:large subunit ribosomal protein L16